LEKNSHLSYLIPIGIPIDIPIDTPKETPIDIHKETPKETPKGNGKYIIYKKVAFILCNTYRYTYRTPKKPFKIYMEDMEHYLVNSHFFLLFFIFLFFLK
jgi:hypothetical protein